MTFLAGGQLVSQVVESIWTELLYERNFPLDCQTSREKSSSQLVNLPRAQLLMKPFYITELFKELNIQVVKFQD